MLHSLRAAHAHAAHAHAAHAHAAATGCTVLTLPAPCPLPPAPGMAWRLMRGAWA